MATRLLFEGAGLGDLLARVREEHGPDARIVSADRIRSGGFAGFFTRESYAITVEVDPPPAEPERPVDAPGTLLELADAIDTAEAAETRVVLGTGPDHHHRHTPPTCVHEPGSRGVGKGRDVHTSGGRPALSTDSPYFAEVLARWAGEPAPVPAPARPAPAAPPRAAADPRLLALGLPPDVAARVDAAGGLWEGLVAALGSALPAQPDVDLRAGDILVVAGPAQAALDLARTLAARLRLDPAGVLLAAPARPADAPDDALRIPGPAAARRRAGALRRAETPTVVAVEAPCDGASAGWAREVADALGARVTLALVDATTKPADAAAHLEALGRCDGIAVHNTAATRDPAAVLGLATDLGLPTVWLDDRPGDARAWASLLAGRLGDGGGTGGTGIRPAPVPGQRGRHRKSLAERT